MSPLGFLGGDQRISRTLAPAAFTVGGSRPSGAVSKVRTYTPPPTPHPSPTGKIGAICHKTHTFLGKESCLSFTLMKQIYQYTIVITHATFS